MDNKNIATTIDGFGSVEAKNDIASFTLTIRSKDENLETAKRQTQEKSAQALREIEKLNLKFHEKWHENVSNFKLEHREAGEKYAAGFQSVNTINFTVEIDEKLDELYKQCMKIDQHMSGPYFNIKNRDSLNEQALQKASDNLKEKLHKQCSLLGLSPDKLRIYNWTFSYGGLYGITGATGPQGAQGSPGVYTGMNGMYYNSSNAFLSPVATKLGSIYQELLDVKIEPSNAYSSVTVKVNYVWVD